MLKIVNNEIQIAEQFLQDFKKLAKAKLEFEKLEKKVKDEFKEKMEEYGIKKFDNELFTVTYVAPTTRQSIDTKKLKELHPRIAKKCTKTSDVKSSVRIKLK